MCNLSVNTLTIRIFFFPEVNASYVKYEICEWVFDNMSFIDMIMSR